MAYTEEFYRKANGLIEAGRYIDSRGWVPATSGNFSARLADGTIAITVSGRRKGCLQTGDIMLIDASGKPLDGKKPSAETLLHTALYRRFPESNAILHPHSRNATLASKLFNGQVVLKDYELLKAFSGYGSHEGELAVPIFANDQDIARLADVVDRYLDNHGPVHAYLIAGHGLYTWADSIESALRYLEALDFLLACELDLRRLKS